MSKNLSLTDALDNGDSEIAIPFTLQHRELVLCAMANIAENPSLYLSDYFEHNLDDINTFLDDIVDRLMIDMIVQPEIGYQDRQSFDMAYMKNYIGTSAITFTYWSNIGMAFNPTTPALNNTVQLEKVFLRAGKWKMSFRAVCTSASAQADITFDGASNYQFFNNVELYSASVAHKLFFSSEISIASDMLGTVNIAAVAKNASSSNYGMNLISLQLERTGDL